MNAIEKLTQEINLSIKQGMTDKEIFDEIVSASMHLSNPSDERSPKPELLIAVIRKQLPIIKAAEAYAQEHGACGTDCDLVNSVQDHKEYGWIDEGGDESGNGNIKPLDLYTK
jgi:hypothetical protein